MKRSQRIGLDKKELTAVLTAAFKESPRDHCLLLMAYRHGLRASEVCNLTLSDLQDSYLVVNRLKHSRRTIQAIESHPGHPEMDERKALAKWLKHREEDGSGALFLSREGGKLCRQQVFRIFKRYARQAGLPKDRQFVHSLKHTLACDMVRANVNLSLIQQQLGHASLSSTACYVHPTDQQASEATRRALLAIY